jgi:ABC-type transport system involved in cytochrome c biogenesis permease component
MEKHAETMSSKSALPPAFSIQRILVLAVNTLTELARLKIFYFLLIFALLVIGNSLFMASLSFEEEFQMLKDVSLGAMSIFTSLLAILATAMMLPKDIEDRTIYTILAKPVPRFEYLAGKLLGILLLLGISTIVMAAMFFTVLWFRETTVIADAQRQMVGADGAVTEELTAYIAKVQASAFNANLIPGVVVVFLKAALLAALTLFVSTFATSAIFAMIISIAIYFIGHLQATAREYWLQGVDIAWWTRGLVAIVALVFPDLQAFSLADDIVAGNAVPMGLFLQTAGLGALYVGVYYLLACVLFSGREL